MRERAKGSAPKSKCGAAPTGGNEDRTIRPEQYRFPIFLSRVALTGSARRLRERQPHPRRRTERGRKDEHGHGIVVFSVDDHPLLRKGIAMIVNESAGHAGGSRHPADASYSRLSASTVRMLL